MVHRKGPFDREQLVNALVGYLPLDGEKILSIDIEYIEEEQQGEVMLANFIWLNAQWIYVDSRRK